MATIVEYVASDSRTFDLYEFINEDPQVSKATSTSYRIDFGDNQYSIVKGTNFVYDSPNSFPSSGTTTYAATYADGKIVGKISGLNITSEQAYNYIVSGDPVATNKSVFGGADTVVGSAFNDYIDGFGGNDTITGGLGRDTLKGNTGADTFVFKTLADSTVSSTGRDTILDFKPGQHDTIHLKSIDAISGTSANDAFSFIGDAAFTKHAGELRAVVSGSNTLVSGDVDGNGKADFSILLKGIVELHTTDFVL
ncbi:hypothetical protein [Methylobacterium sp. 77]|uniref:calcium-binding protein n=1 Tax=Methylobacterium sp. 77 TaxID=1101192 RepID=UPI000378C721|nr:hypothetical protein [Methylobacterium sp. 77]